MHSMKSVGLSFFADLLMRITEYRVSKFCIYLFHEEEMTDDLEKLYYAKQR